MSQYDFDVIDPLTIDGDDLADIMGQWRDALYTWHGGTDRPSYAQPGMAWIKIVSATAHEVYYYDGSDDILLFSLDLLNNRVLPAIYALNWQDSTWSFQISADGNSVYFRPQGEDVATAQWVMNNVASLYSDDPYASLYINVTAAEINPADPVDGMSYYRGNKRMNLARDDGECLNLIRDANNGAVAGFWRNGAVVGTISVTTTGTTFATTSDYRVKLDVTPIDNAAEIIAALKPSRYHMTLDNSAEWHNGFVAHELQEVIPQAVTGEKDGKDLQAVDMSKIVPFLVAELQELRRQFNDYVANHP